MEMWTLQGEILLEVFSHTFSAAFSPADFLFNETFSDRTLDKKNALGANARIPLLL